MASDIDPGPQATIGQRRRRTRRGIPLLWAFPGLALAVAVHFVAVGAGAWYAFTDWNGISASAQR